MEKNQPTDRKKSYLPKIFLSMHFTSMNNCGKENSLPEEQAALSLSRTLGLEQKPFSVN